jgi:DNA-binding NarL/FixJ family response regulator
MRIVMFMRFNPLYGQYAVTPTALPKGIKANPPVTGPNTLKNEVNFGAAVPVRFGAYKSDTERQIEEKLRQGWSGNKIAKSLNVTHSTVSYYKKKLAQQGLTLAPNQNKQTAAPQRQDPLLQRLNPAIVQRLKWSVPTQDIVAELEVTPEEVYMTRDKLKRKGIAVKTYKSVPVNSYYKTVYQLLKQAVPLEDIVKTVGLKAPAISDYKRMMGRHKDPYKVVFPKPLTKHQLNALQQLNADADIAQRLKWRMPTPDIIEDLAKTRPVTAEDVYLTKQRLQKQGTDLVMYPSLPTTSHYKRVYELLKKGVPIAEVANQVDLAPSTINRYKKMMESYKAPYAVVFPNPGQN